MLTYDNSTMYAKLIFYALLRQSFDQHGLIPAIAARNQQAPWTHINTTDPASFTADNVRSHLVSGDITFIPDIGANREWITIYELLVHEGAYFAPLVANRIIPATCVRWPAIPVVSIYPGAFDPVDHADIPANHIFSVAAAIANLRNEAEAFIDGFYKAAWLIGMEAVPYIRCYEQVFHDDGRPFGDVFNIVNDDLILNPEGNPDLPPQQDVPQEPVVGPAPRAGANENEDENNDDEDPEQQVQQRQRRQQAAAVRREEDIIAQAAQRIQQGRGRRSINRGEQITHRSNKAAILAAFEQMQQRLNRQRQAQNIDHQIMGQLVDFMQNQQDKVPYKERQFRRPERADLLGRIYRAYPVDAWYQITSMTWPRPCDWNWMLRVNNVWPVFFTPGPDWHVLRSNAIHDILRLALVTFAITRVCASTVLYGYNITGCDLHRYIANHPMSPSLTEVTCGFLLDMPIAQSEQTAILFDSTLRMIQMITGHTISSTALWKARWVHANNRG